MAQLEAAAAQRQRVESHSSTIQEYLTNNYAMEINKSKENEDLVGYLPHHPVMHSLKPNKVRIVFDCGAKYEGVSLNDSLMPGPCLTINLVGVLTRFRMEQVALIGDIQAMFHQIKVVPRHRNA